MDRRPAKRRWRSAQTLGVAVSVLIHVAAIIAIVTTARPTIDLPVARPIEMELIAPTIAKRRPITAAPASKSPRAVVSVAKSSSASTQPAAATVAPPTSGIAETQTPTATSTPSAGLGTTLRGSVGCEHAGLFALSEEERRHCRERLATGRATSAEYADLGIDPEKRAVFDAAWTADHSPQHMAGFACLAKFGHGKLQWAHPSEGVKAPLLPCYLYTPKATFSVDPPHKSVW